MRGRVLKKWLFFATLGDQIIFNWSEIRWVYAPEIMGSNDTIFILWGCFKKKWQCPLFLAKSPKMSKNQNLSNFAQFWRAWPSWVFRSMLRSGCQNLKPWYAFLHFLCRAPLSGLLDFFLCSLQLPSGELIKLLIVPSHFSLKVQISIGLSQLLLQVFIHPFKPFFSIVFYLLGE